MRYQWRMPQPAPALSVIVTTYRNPHALRLCLNALAADLTGLPPVELIVGDDGDPDHLSRGPSIEAASWRTFAGVRRLWQQHDGYGKCRLANKAAGGARAPVLFYLDGDCLVARGTVKTHLRLSRPRSYVAGGVVRLGQQATRALDVEAVRLFRHVQPAWIARQALKGGVESNAHYAWLNRSAILARLFRRTGSGGFTGGCSSVPSSLLIEVNGWDEALPGYGFDDTDLSHRLQNAGAVPISARVEAMVVHLWHERPYRGDDDYLETKRIQVAQTLHGKHIRATKGLAERSDADPPLWEEL